VVFSTFLLEWNANNNNYLIRSNSLYIPTYGEKVDVSIRNSGIIKMNNANLI